MDKQHRILIPQGLRELANLELSKSYALCIEDDLIFYLVDIDKYQDQLAVDKVTLDVKGRFILSPNIIEHFKIPPTATEWFFVEKQKVYISFVK